MPRLAVEKIQFLGVKEYIRNKEGKLTRIWGPLRWVVIYGLMGHLIAWRR